MTKSRQEETYSGEAGLGPGFFGCRHGFLDGGVCGAGAVAGGGVGVAGFGTLFDGAWEAFGIVPSKMRRVIPGASTDSGLMLTEGSSALPVTE